MKNYNNMSLKEFNPTYANIASLGIKEDNKYSHAEGSNSIVYGNISRVGGINKYEDRKW